MPFVNDSTTGMPLLDTTPSGDAGGALETRATICNVHLKRTDNPHTVTAAQVGAYTQSQADTLLASKQAVGTAYTPGVGLLTDATTIATNAAAGNHFRVTLGGNRTLGNPTNPTDGQKVTWEVIQDGTGNKTLAYGSAFSFGTDLPSITLSTAASKRDFIGAIYNSTMSKWYVVSFIKGY